MMPLEKKAISDAVRALKDESKERKFVQSIDLVINLRDIDPKKPEGKIQELVELPHVPGKKNRVCVIASGEMALKAKRAGSDLVLGRSDLEALAGDRKKQKQLAKTYDSFIAEAPMMPLVGRALGATLGPKGKMPTPVSPAEDIAERIEKHRKMVLIRMRGQPVLQCRVGTEDMGAEEIAENVRAVITRIERKLKRGIKNIKTIILKTTMGPLVKVKP